MMLTLDLIKTGFIVYKLEGQNTRLKKAGNFNGQILRNLHLIGSLRNLKRHNLGLYL